MATVRHLPLAPILFSFLCLPSFIASQSFNFNFSQHHSISHADLKVFFLNSTHPKSQQGPAVASAEAEPSKEMIHSEMETIDQNIAGVVYAQPVTLWDQATSEVASFRLTLAFCLRNYHGGTRKNSTVSRMAIFLGPAVPQPVMSNGANHNNPNTTTSTDQIIEVEFDIYLQEKHDNNGHSRTISVDVNYIVSKAQVNTSLSSSTMNKQSSGCTMMMVQMDYDGGRKRLDTSLRIGDVSHHINASVDLRKTMPKEAPIGIVSTTGQPIELHNVLYWSFNSTLGRSRTNSTVTVAVTPSESPTVPWWGSLVRLLDPWNWSMEWNLQLQFERVWDRISLAISSSFNIKLESGISNWS